MNRKTNKPGDYGLRINYKARLTFFLSRVVLLCPGSLTPSGPKQGSAAPEARGIRGTSHAAAPLLRYGERQSLAVGRGDSGEAPRSGALGQKVRTGSDGWAGGGNVARGWTHPR